MCRRRMTSKIPLKHWTSNEIKTSGWTIAFFVICSVLMYWCICVDMTYVLMCMLMGTTVCWWGGVGPCMSISMQAVMSPGLVCPVSPHLTPPPPQWLVRPCWGHICSGHHTQCPHHVSERMSVCHMRMQQAAAALYNMFTIERQGGTRPVRNNSEEDRSYFHINPKCCFLIRCWDNLETVARCLWVMWWRWRYSDTLIVTMEMMILSVWRISYHLSPR